MVDMGLAFQPGALSEILTMANLWQTANRIWTCAFEFRFCWKKLHSSDNYYYTTAPQNNMNIEYLKMNKYK